MPEDRPSPAIPSVDTDGDGSKPPRRYRGLDPQQRRAERRRRLLDAGLEVFGTVGFTASTITGLCREAGVTTAHFYEEFGGREALLWAVFDEVLTQAADQVSHAMADAPVDLPSQARAGLAAFLHSMLDDPRRGRVQCLETVGVSAEFESRRRDLLRAYAKVVSDTGVAAAEAAGRDVVPTRFIALALVAGVNDAVIEWLLLERRPSVDELIEELLELFLAAGEHYGRPRAPSSAG